MSKQRVVVTGLGMVTPLGLNVKDTWDATLAGKSGVAAIEHFDTSGLSCRICSTVKDFDPSPYMEPKDARKRDLFIQYGVAAAVQAMEDSGIEVTDSNSHRFGVAIGSGIGGLPMIEKAHDVLNKLGPRKVSPFFIPSVIINMISGNVSIKYGSIGFPTIN